MLLDTEPVFKRRKFKISLYYFNTNKMGSIFFITYILINLTWYNIMITRTEFYGYKNTDKSKKKCINIYIYKKN